MSGENKIKVLIVKPEEKPYAEEIDCKLETFQSIVGGNIEEVYIESGTVLICHEEGKLLGLTPNRVIGNDVICGTFFLAGDDGGEELVSLSDEKIEKYTEELKEGISYYDESVSPKTWLKRKYTGPYYYGGTCEHYLYAATQAKAFKQQNPVLRIGPSFEEFMAGKKGDRMVKINNVTMDESRLLFETGTDELLERLTIGEVLASSVDEAWELKTEKLIHEMNGSFSDNYKKIRTMKNDYDIESFYRKTNPKVVPLSDRLIYSYDYGDGWQIEITCVDELESFDRWNKPSEDSWVLAPTTNESIAEEQQPIDRNGKEPEGELREQIISVIVKRRPICIAADGLPLLDDVGGIQGYCDFLLSVHGKYEDKEETIDRGRRQGWNGRMNKPENIL